MSINLQTQPEPKLYVPAIRSRRVPGQIGGLLCAGLLAVSVLPLAAQINNDGIVAVGGSHILTVRYPAGGMSIKQRADAITDRLNTFLAYDDLKPGEVTVKAMGKNSAKIMVRNKLFVTVTQHAADYNHTTPLALANMWVGNIRNVLLSHNVTPGPDIPVRKK